MTPTGRPQMIPGMIQSTFTVGRSVTHPAPELLDEFIATYISWREECASVRSSYEHWLSCPCEERPLAFASYVAALDREEKAATVHSAPCERLGAAVRATP